MNTQLRHEGGGDPARSNSTDLKNEPNVPTAGNDFPDAPTNTGGPTQDQPDLEAFAKKLGTDTIETGDGLSAVPDRSESDRSGEESATDPRPVFAAVALAAAILGLAVWRRRRRSRISRIVETIDVFDVVS